MKFFNKKSPYIQGGITALAVIVLSILFYFGIDYFGHFLKAIGRFVGIISPFLWGLVIAYLLSPLMSLLERTIFKPLLERYYRKHPKAKSHPKLARGLSVTLAVILMLVIITLLIYLIAPQVYDSLETIIVNSPEYISRAYQSIDRMLKDYPEIEEYTAKIFGSVTDTLNGWIKNTVLPGMENVVVNITTGVYNVLKVLYNIIIGIVVAIYILGSKESFLAYTRKLMHSIFSEKAAAKLTRITCFLDRTFMGFFVGNALDALIIGFVCYAFCLVMRMPYALLISVIVGVTNFIPFFGPFIGGIPSALLIFIVKPIKALWFVIFIVILQQLDGTYIKPKILGEGLGINGFWVMFSIILFGGLFGFWGMLLGVPVFVVIYKGISMLVNNSLAKKQMPQDAAEYREKEKDVGAG